MRPPSTRRRITLRESRASTRPKAVSLEKIDQTGSIKINKSSVDKITRYAVSVGNEVETKEKVVVGLTVKTTLRKEKKGALRHWREKGFNCQSKKFSNNSAQERKVDTS